MFQQELALREQLVADFPAKADYRRGLFLTLNNHAVELDRAGLSEIVTVTARLESRIYPVNDPDLVKQAQTYFARAAAQDRQLLADAPDDPLYRRDLSITLSNLGRLRDAAGDFEAVDVDRLYTEVVALREHLVGDFPTDAGYRRELAGALRRRGAFLSSRRRLPEAEKCFRQAIVHWEREAEVAAASPESPHENTKSLSCVSW